MLAARTRTGLAAVAVVAVLAGCGGSSSSSSTGVTASAYVKAICSAIGPFEKDVQNRSNALNLASITNVSQGKNALVGFLNAMVADTDNTVTQLKAAGTPDIKSGQQISNSVVTAFSQLKAALARAATQAKKLPTKSPTAFQAAATGLGNTVKTSIGAIGTSLNALQNPDLEKAAATDPTCKSLASS
jgi:hypothetical protein